MRVAVIKLGSRISINSVGTSGGTGEALAIINILTNAGVAVDVYTKVSAGDIMPNDFNIYNIETTYKNVDVNYYDALIVLNGNVNYFGGVDSPSQTLNYYFINKLNCPVYYIMCDCNLFLKQVWPSIEKKSWASNYNKKDIEIVRDDIIYVTQAKNTKLVLEKARKYVNIKDAIYFPFEKFPMLTLCNWPINQNPEYDILYGGTFRSGRREEDMVKFYFGYSPDIKVEMFGNITLDNFNQDKVRNLRAPDFGKSVQYDLFSSKMHKAISTVIIGDKIYKKLDDLAQRIYESIMIGNVVFIDSSYDFSKRVFKDKELLEFNYVNSIKDVEYKLKMLKEDFNFRKHIIDLQREDTKIDIKDYCNKFKDIINGGK